MANWNKLPQRGRVEDRRKQPLNPLRQQRYDAQKAGTHQEIRPVENFKHNTQYWGSLLKKRLGK